MNYIDISKTLFDILSAVFQVLVIAFFFHSWLRLMRNNASAFAFSALLCVIAGLAFVSFIFPMPVLNAICRYLILQMPLLMIVIFQNEIKRGFTGFTLSFREFFSEHIGSRQKISHDIMIIELVKAVCAMTTRPEWRFYLQNVNGVSADQELRFSEVNTGALIALQGRQGNLLQYVKNYVRMDCAANSMLLLTIFYKGTPLHDGGVIINDKDRIVAAGCLFPQYKTDDKNFSEQAAHTRHNAARGLCHDVDCLVIVVSEETGLVHVCQGDAMPRVMQSPTQLLGVLREFYKIGMDTLVTQKRFRWLRGLVGGFNHRG